MIPFTPEVLESWDVPCKFGGPAALRRISRSENSCWHAYDQTDFHNQWRASRGQSPSMGLGNIRNPRIAQELIEMWKYADREIEMQWSDDPDDLYGAKFISSRCASMFFGELFRDRSSAVLKAWAKALKKDFYRHFPHKDPRAPHNRGSSEDEQEAALGLDKPFDDLDSERFDEPYDDSDDPLVCRGGFDSNLEYPKATAGRDGIPQ